MAQSATQQPDLLPLAELPLDAEEADRVSLIDFAVDRDGELPLGTQLDWRIRGMLVRGALRPGDRIPSVRELASFAGVNVNTARAVYSRLEEEGLIDSVQGLGTFVGEAAAELRALEPVAAEALRGAAEQDVDPKQLAAAIYSVPGTDPDHPRERLEPFPEIDHELGEPALKRALRDQIARLEREVADYAWHDSLDQTAAAKASIVPVGRVIGVEELESIRAELIDRLRKLRGEASVRERRQEAARMRVEEMVANPDEHRWEIVTGDEIGDPGCKSWRVVPAFGPVGAIMGWWRVKVSSGCPLAGPLAAAPHRHHLGRTVNDGF